MEGDPSVSSRTPQASTQTAQSIAQGDNATPLETELRQRGNMESQRAADSKAARDASLVATNRERRQEQLKAAQELVECLGAGMGAALVVELLARPIWVRCTGRQFPLDRVLDKVVSPVVERALAASHLAWARLLAATIYVLRRRRSETVEVGVDNLTC